MGRAVLGSLRHIATETDPTLRVVRALHSKVSAAAQGLSLLNDPSGTSSLAKPSAGSAVNASPLVYTFGSCCVFGVAEPKSDVDFVLLTAKDASDEGPDTPSQTARGWQTQSLAKFSAKLRSQNPTFVVEEVRRARVPVVRVKAAVSVPLSGNSDPVTSTTTMAQVKFDVTAHRRNGVRNSALLRAYFDQCPIEARWLAMAVKAWSKRVGVNLGSPGGFITSYGLNLLVVYYLLRHGKVRYVPIEKFRNCQSIPPLPNGTPLELPADEEAFGALLLDWLAFYTKEFVYEEEVVTLTGRVRGAAASSSEPPSVLLRSKDLGWTREAEDQLAQRGSEGERISYRLCIEDPYEVNLNVGRLVTPLKLDLFKRLLVAAGDNGFGVAVGQKPI